MQSTIRRIVSKLLRDTANKIDAGTCELSEQEASDIMQVLLHKALSKEQACEYLNIRRSRFDELVRDGVIPKGKKRKGFNELVWYEDELNNVLLNKH